MNDKILLDALISQKKAAIAPDTSDNDFFNIFVSEQVLKEYDLSYDEIIEGIVEGGGDGGIDSIYTFINGELINEDTDIISLKKEVIIDLIIIQSKNTDGFSESALEKFNSSAIDLLNLGNDLDTFRSVYIERLLSKIGIFRTLFVQHISKFPTLNIKYYYGTKGSEVHPNVQRKTTLLETSIKNLFNSCSFSFEFLKSADLLSLARKEPTKTRQVSVDENPISTTDGGYIALVNIAEYYKFITDDTGKLIKQFFDANVRDYQGSVEVNSEIKNSLLNPTGEEFWWLNNGITIIANNASLSSKILTIEDPQIVNGLQSSFELYNYIHHNRPTDEKRKILLRVIKTSDENSRLRIIKATNSQTSIPLASLRATDEIHRDIEEYFLNKGLFYDRRKNYYKNQGKPLNKIIAIQFVSQAVTAILLQKPDFSRARPTTLIKNDKDYEKIFNTSFPLETYLSCVKLMKNIENASQADSLTFSGTQFGDIKYHAALYLTIIKAGKVNYKPRDIETLALDTIPQNEIISALQILFDKYTALGGTNKVAKGTEFVDETIALARQKINTTPNSGLA